MMKNGCINQQLWGLNLKPTIMEIKQTMNDIGILKTKHVYLYIATKTWLYSGFNFFGSSLPENVIREPNQLGFAPGRQVHMSKFQEIFSCRSKLQYQYWCNWYLYMVIVSATE